MEALTQHCCLLVVLVLIPHVFCSLHVLNKLFHTGIVGELLHQSTKHLNQHGQYIE